MCYFYLFCFFVFQISRFETDMQQVCVLTFDRIRGESCSLNRKEHGRVNSREENFINKG